MSLLISIHFNVWLLQQDIVFLYIPWSEVEDYFLRAIFSFLECCCTFVGSGVIAKLFSQWISRYWLWLDKVCILLTVIFLIILQDFFNPCGSPLSCAYYDNWPSTAPHRVLHTFNYSGEYWGRAKEVANLELRIL